MNLRSSFPCDRAWAVAGSLLLFVSAAPAQNFSSVPGVVIDYEEAPDFFELLLNDDVYIADVEIVVLPNGNYLASHSYFGGGSTEDTAGVTKVFRSTNQGTSWSLIATFSPLWRASMFVYNGAVYIIGPTHNGGSYQTIRKSIDNGSTWTTPSSAATGRFESVPQTGTMGTPNNPLVFKNRLYAGGGNARTFSTPTSTSDPLDASDWTAGGGLGTHSTWPVGLAGQLGSAFIGEAQIVAAPHTGIAILGKVEGLPYTAVVRTENTAVRFGYRNDFASLPGAEKKFGAQYDPVSGKFWAITNPILDQYQADGSLTPQLKRNCAALFSSRDLMNWDMERVVAFGNNLAVEAFQYFQFDIEGDDIVAVSRTAWDVGQGEEVPPRGHDSNLMTFHRIANFRTSPPAQVLQLDTPNNAVLRRERTPDTSDDNPLIGTHFHHNAGFQGTSLTSPSGLGQDPATGDVYVMESGGGIVRFDALGNFIERPSSAPVGFTSGEISITQPPAGERGWRKGSGNWAEPNNWYYWTRADTSDELAVFGSSATAPATITVNSDPLLWDFNIDGDREGWTASNVDGGGAVAAGVFSGTSNSTQPLLNRLGLAFEGSTHPQVTFNLKATGSNTVVDFLWGHTTADSFSSARKITLAYTGEGAFQEFIVDMAGNPDWDGRIITRMRIELPEESGSTFELDLVRIPQESFTIKGMRFRNPTSAAYTIAGGGSLRLAPPSGNAVIEVKKGVHTVDVPLTLAATLDVVTDTACGVNFNDPVTGTGGINKSGDGTLLLDATNTYSGNLVINGGIVQIGTGIPIPSGPGYGNVILNAGATMDLLGNNETINGLSGAGTVDNTDPAAVIFNVGANNATSVFDGIIANTGGLLTLQKSGSGTLTLNGNNAYDGGSSVSAGTLQIGPSADVEGAVTVTSAAKFELLGGGGGEAIGALNGAGTVNSAGAPNLDIGQNDETGSFSGVITNTAGALLVRKIGLGTQTFTGANTFTGGFQLQAGTARVGASSVAGVSGPLGSDAGAVTISGNTTITSNSAGARTILNPINVNGDFTIGQSTGGTGNLTFGGAVNLGSATRMLTIDNSATTISGAISNGSLVKSGPGKLTLSGANTFAGNVTVTAGSLALGAANVIPNGAGKGNVAVDDTLLLNGLNETINGLSGAGIIDGVSGAPVLTVGDNNQSSTFGGMFKNTAGSLSVVKTGAGTLTLSGASTHSGMTTVNGGGLVLASSLSSAVALNSGLLNATGMFNGTVTLNGGIYAPGGVAATGIATHAGNLAVGLSATLRVRINGTGPGGQHDQVLLTGGASAVSLGGTLEIVASPSLPAGASFAIIDNAGSAAPVSGAFANRPAGIPFKEDGLWWNISYSGGTGNDVVLTRMNAPSEEWMTAHGIASMSDDEERDGLIALMEYTLDGDPDFADAQLLPRLVLTGNKLALTFERTLDRTDLTLTVRGADSVTGPWTDLARGIGGAAFTALAGSVTETGSGPSRTVTVSDAFILGDPAHPRRFLQLEVMLQP